MAVETARARPVVREEVVRSRAAVLEEWARAARESVPAVPVVPVEPALEEAEPEQAALVEAAPEEAVQAAREVRRVRVRVQERLVLVGQPEPVPVRRVVPGEAAQRVACRR